MSGSSGRRTFPTLGVFFVATPLDLWVRSGSSPGAWSERGDRQTGGTHETFTAWNEHPGRCSDSGRSGHHATTTSVVPHDITWSCFFGAWRVKDGSILRGAAMMIPGAFDVSASLSTQSHQRPAIRGVGGGCLGGAVLHRMRLQLTMTMKATSKGAAALPPCSDRPLKGPVTLGIFHPHLFVFTFFHIYKKDQPTSSDCFFPATLSHLSAKDAFLPWLKSAGVAGSPPRLSRSFPGVTGGEGRDPAEADPVRWVVWGLSLSLSCALGASSEGLRNVDGPPVRSSVRCVHCCAPRNGGWKGI